ncbi:MAG: hypothetical protein ACKVJD_10070 [Burkholderiales bacterium]|jgi:hypothetical protein|tara:strand:- start:396 stop:614 length:219 start_codon:yes stop_codon:yes gene_type:complete
MTEPFNKGPNCWQCQHFGISYDPKLPYLCRLMGFKTRMLPAIEVLRADGQYCQGFTPKPDPQQSKLPKSIWA